MASRELASEGSVGIPKKQRGHRIDPKVFNPVDRQPRMKGGNTKDSIRDRKIIE